MLFVDPGSVFEPAGHASMHRGRWARYLDWSKRNDPEEIAAKELFLELIPKHKVSREQNFCACYLTLCTLHPEPKAKAQSQNAAAQGVQAE